MTKRAVNKVTSSIALIAITLFFVYLSGWIVNYFEEQNKQLPEWLYYAFMVAYVLIISVFYDKFIKAFSKSDYQKKPNRDPKK
ncbi:hypothetical protein AB4140_15485 [Shewanella sp. 10N.286.51.B2]|uniref:hypothetical protein n=1 Tax=unclassified Shewanella TaxID=196818 RepID=UPI0026E3AE6D|nr:hypothetical protein [Shewanella sp. 5_MG-2023]MDO6642092.1 hypothetical protein [Shewanella sp. 5_MG-2023]